MTAEERTVEAWNLMSIHGQAPSLVAPEVKSPQKVSQKKAKAKASKEELKEPSEVGVKEIKSTKEIV